MLYRAKRIQVTRPTQQIVLTYPTLQQLALFPAFEHDGLSWELLLLSKILLFLTQSVVLMASLIVYHKCSMEYSFNCHILFLNKVKLYMLSVHNIPWGKYVPWAVACHVKCASLVMRSLSMLRAVLPHTAGCYKSWCLLQYRSTLTPLFLSTWDFVIFLISASPVPLTLGTSTAHSVSGHSLYLAPSRRDIAVVFVFCAWLISLNIVSSEFILSFHKFRISFMTL